MNSAGKIVPLLPRLWRTRRDEAETQAPSWRLLDLAGRLIELGGNAQGAALTMAFALVAEAQRSKEPVAWIGLEASSFYPPDVADGGVDLASLVVVRLKQAEDVARAADQLARSGAFGVLLVDLEGGVKVSPALESRLLGLAQKHDIAIVFLTAMAHGRVQRNGLGSLVSLRAVARREAMGKQGFRCSIEVTKDKRHAPDWSYTEACHGPAGLR